MPDAVKSVEVEVLRYRPEQEDAPVWQRYVVPFSHDLSVLQALQHVKDEIDGTLSFRWSCRMAICGSCGMMVNGKPALSCQTFVRDLLPGPVRIEALAHFPIERDLVVNVEGFVHKLESIKPYLIPKEPRTLAQGEYLQTPAQLEQFEQFSSCINCMLCYAACPQFGLDRELHRPGRARAAAPLQRRLARRRPRAAHGDPQRRGGRVELHRGGLLLRGLSQARRPGQRSEPEQGQ